MNWSPHLQTSRVAALLGLALVVGPAGCGREAPTHPRASTGSIAGVGIPDGSALHTPGHPDDHLDRKLPPGLFEDDPAKPGSDSPDRVDSRTVLVEVEGIPPEGAFRSNGAVIVEEYPEIGMVKVTSVRGMASTQLAVLLERKAGVIGAEPDRYLQAPESQGMPISFNDGEFDKEDTEHQPFLERLHVVEAHALARARATRVAILDTGVDPDHPALAGRIRAGEDYVDHDKLPWEVMNGIDSDGDGLIDEAFGHGTHVTGLIAMLAPEAELDIYRILDDDGWGIASDVAQAILRAVRDGADVINLSLGMHAPFRAIEKAVDYATRRGVVVIGAAGNDGVGEPVQYPASYSLALGVGSADSADRLSAFSNFGPSVYVTAPGERVLSSYPGGGYASATGTSMATAVVSALAALVMERHNGTMRNRDRTDEVTRRIARCSVVGTGVPGLTGHGRVDFLEAVRH